METNKSKGIFRYLLRHACLAANDAGLAAYFNLSTTEQAELPACRLWLLCREDYSDEAVEASMKDRPHLRAYYQALPG